MDSGPDRDPLSNGNGARPKRRRRLLLPKPPGPPKDKGPRDRPKLRKLRFALVLLGLSMLAAVSWVFGIMMAVAQDLPSLENRDQYLRAQNSVVYDVNGVKLATLTNNQGRILLESDEIAPVMKEAVVSIEDGRFYDHRGIDFQGMARALYQDVLAGSAQQGASTITQQFVKNALAAQESRTILQKFREAAIAYHLERQWSKDKILTSYLNEIYFGEGATGIEAAARTYFGWNHPGCGEGEAAPSCASQLLPWEAALLAGIISSPTAYSPRNLPESALDRRDLVLQRMMEQGYITESEYVEYSNPDVHPLPRPNQIQPPAENSEAPYFTSWLRQQLVDRYGAGEAFGGGLHITSTLDLELQRSIESIAATRVGGIEPTTSIVVLDNDTAAVRAMYGGSDYQDSPFNLATNGHRQPGSSFKPFTLMAALEEGHSTSEVFTSAPKDIPFKVHYENKNGQQKTAHELFDVNNYEDTYLGSADLATATTYSDNSVYAELGLQVGPESVAETAHKLGIETDLRTPNEYSIDGGPYAPYNPAMILGGLETGVTPLEMAHAYNTIAADGQRLSGTMASSSGGPLGIVEVTDAPPGEDGDPVADTTGASGENEVVAKQVVEPELAQTAKEVLSTVVESGTGENAATGEPTWGKTGTTDDNGDAWFCGATEDITACVWVGHADTVEPMLTEYGGAPVDGGTIPALIFADVVNAYVEIEASRKAGDEPTKDPDELPPPTGDPAPAPEPAPATEPAPEEVAPASAAEAPAAEAAAEPAPDAAPADGGGTVAPTGGGVAAG
jgi:penicillin-binding protein 1A